MHSKTQRQVSPGTYVAVLALAGLEGPPTACGVPLCSMAKSNPPSVFVRLQESLHRGNSTPVGLLLRTRKSPTGAGSTSKTVSLAAVTVPPRDYTFQNLRTQPLQYTVYIIEQPLQSGILHSIPLLLPVRTRQTPICARPTPVPQSRKSQAAKASLWFCQNCLPQSTNPAWVNSVTLGAVEGAPLSHRLLRLHFLLHNRPHCPAGTHSLIMFILIITYHLTVREAVFFRAAGLLL